MRVVIAMDSFKGSMSTIDAGNAVKCGVLRVFPDAEVEVCPMADGGEGSMEVLVFANNGAKKKVLVKNPLGEPILAEYGLICDKKTAVIEMAQAAGITLISERERNPMHTTTYGVGELIADAIAEGARKFIVGIGGSATNDGGVGMLQALGFEFLDKNGEVVPFGACGLSQIDTIKTDKVIPEIYESEFVIACDVENELCGENGASFVYGAQKGADADMIATMDSAMKNYEEKTKKINPKASGNIAGSGAAGGLGFAFLSYLGGKLESGIKLIIEKTGIEEKIKNADIVITGEGRLDGQSYMGKTPVGIAEVAKKHKKPVIAFAGGVTEDAKCCNNHGIDAFFPILKSPCTLDDAMARGKENLADSAEQVFRVVKSI